MTNSWLGLAGELLSNSTSDLSCFGRASSLVPGWSKSLRILVAGVDSACGGSVGGGSPSFSFPSSSFSSISPSLDWRLVSEIILREEFCFLRRGGWDTDFFSSSSSPGGVCGPSLAFSFSGFCSSEPSFSLPTSSNSSPSEKSSK